MDTSFKINTLSINSDETLVYLGTESGEILFADVHDLRVVNRVQSNVGAIYALTAHPTLPLLASMGMDHNVTLWNSENPLYPVKIDRFNLRLIKPWNDVVDIPNNPSQSQAICFHPVAPRLATRGASAGIVELDYESNKFKLVHCTRLHGYEDVTTVRYPSSSYQLISAALGSVVLSENGLVISTWRLAKSNIHWFEPIGDGIYLVATDDRRIIIFDSLRGKVLTEGPIITRDDLEHVTYNKTSKRAFVAGFDRCVYEIDPRTCQPLGIVYKAPFKMRWIKTLEQKPDTMFVQCFDGGVYMVNLPAVSHESKNNSPGRVLATTRSTPPALWTGCQFPDGRIALTGEGDELAFLKIKRDANSRTPRLVIDSIGSKGTPTSYTKRMIAAADGSLWLGQTSGELLRWFAGKSSVINDFGSAIRDLCLTPKEDRILLCLENGDVCSVDSTTNQIIARWHSPSNLPVWALACHPMGEVVAVAERSGKIHFLDCNTLDIVRVGRAARRVKRMKWLDNDTLLYNQVDGVSKYTWSKDGAEDFVEPCGNTVEDFVWDIEYGYLVLISYSTDIILCDLKTGQKQYVGADQTDYSKGLLFLSGGGEGAYPLDFITFGRSGTAHLFRIHNNKCVALGPVMPEILTQRYQINTD